MTQATQPVASIPLRQYCLALVVTSVTFMELLDTTILNTALPAIAASFDTDIVNLRVVITSYLATIAIFIPISGWIADKIGPKHTLMMATALFTAGSVLCGVAASLGMLVLSRILQGIGGAMMTPISRIILVRLFRDRGEYAFQKVAGLVAIPLVFGPILGPVLGGWLTTHWSWRWIFFVNLPIGLLACLAILLMVRNEANPDTPPMDLKGFLLAGAGLAMVTLALELVEDRGMPLLATVSGGFMGLLCLAGAIRRSFRRPNAIFDLALFRFQSFRVGALLTVGVLLIQAGMQALLPTLFQLGFGMDAFQSGLMTVAIAMGVVAMKPIIAPLFRDLGYRWVLTLYPILIGATMLSFYSFNPDTPHWLILTLLFVYGLGLSLHGNVINVIPYLEIPHERVSGASSLQSTLFQFSLSLGMSFGALLLQGLLTAQGLTLTPGAPPEAIRAAFHDSFVICGLLTCAMAFIGSGYWQDPVSKPPERR